MIKYILTKKEFLYSLLIMTLFTSLVLLLLPGCFEIKKISYFSGSLTEAFRKAKKEHKKVFVLVSDSNCGKCKAFANFLDTQKETVEILSNEYICVKPDCRKAKDHIYLEILRNPTYPFPYIFDENGNLLAFGFPETREFRIKNLSDINIKKFFFREIFEMDITPNQYKSLISNSLKATLLLDKFPDSTKKAFELFKKSAELFVYPYNLRNIRLLAIQIGKNQDYDVFKQQYRRVPLDNYLYGKMEEYNFLADLKNHLDFRPTDILKLYQQEVEIGELKVGIGKEFRIFFKNVSGKPLVVSKVEHPCDCIKFKWSSRTFAPQVDGIIEGTFTPNSKGEFIKEIFIHTSSPVAMMMKTYIKGTVK